MSCAYHITPAALSREAERRRNMARHAEDRPVGYTREAWARRCLAVARDLDRRAGQLAAN